MFLHVKWWWPAIKFNATRRNDYIKSRKYFNDAHACKARRAPKNLTFIRPADTFSASSSTVFGGAMKLKVGKSSPKLNGYMKRNYRCCAGREPSLLFSLVLLFSWLTFADDFSSCPQIIDQFSVFFFFSKAVRSINQTTFWQNISPLERHGRDYGSAHIKSPKLKQHTHP
jgi:hypothetical protein